MQSGAPCGAAKASRQRLNELATFTCPCARYLPYAQLESAGLTYPESAARVEDAAVKLEAAQSRSFAIVSHVSSVQSEHSSPTNIFPASASSLNTYLSQFDATFANSPPPG